MVSVQLANLCSNNTIIQGEDMSKFDTVCHQLFSDPYFKHFVALHISAEKIILDIKNQKVLQLLDDRRFRHCFHTFYVKLIL